MSYLCYCVSLMYSMFPALAVFDDCVLLAYVMVSKVTRSVRRLGGTGVLN